MGDDYFGNKKRTIEFIKKNCWVVSFAYFGCPTIFRYLKHNWERFTYEDLHNVYMRPERKPFVF